MRLSLVLAGLIGGIVAEASLAASPQRPNFVVFITDDQPYEGLSCTGNPILKTPHLDQLAERGVLFEKALATTAICCCSRASIYSGQHMRRHGIKDFKTPLSREKWQRTFPALLRKAGYRTALLGKFAVGQPFVDKELSLPKDQFDFWYGFPQSIAFKQIIDGRERYLTTVMEEKNDGLSDNMLAVFEYPKATATIRSSAVEIDGGERRHLVVCGTRGTFHIQPLDNPSARITLSEVSGQYSRGYQSLSFPKYVRYINDAADMAKIIRGEKETDFSTQHDLIVLASLLKACGQQ